VLITSVNPNRRCKANGEHGTGVGTPLTNGGHNLITGSVGVPQITAIGLNLFVLEHNDWRQKWWCEVFTLPTQPVRIDKTTAETNEKSWDCHHFV
jgi:hypothetical protein